MISVFDRLENIVGKGENVGYQHFLLFPLCFETASFPDTSKDLVWESVKPNRIFTDLTVSVQRKLSTHIKINTGIRIHIGSFTSYLVSIEQKSIKIKLKILVKQYK